MQVSAWQEALCSLRGENQAKWGDVRVCVYFYCNVIPQLIFLLHASCHTAVKRLHTKRLTAEKLIAHTNPILMQSINLHSQGKGMLEEEERKKERKKKKRFTIKTLEIQTQSFVKWFLKRLHQPLNGTGSHTRLLTAGSTTTA